jgi:hypothetical protein
VKYHCRADDEDNGGAGYAGHDVLKEASFEAVSIASLLDLRVAACVDNKSDDPWNRSC